MHLHLVEDDDSLRASLALQLRDEGFSVEAFSDAESCLEAFEQADAPPQLLLVDVRLRGLSGVGLIERLSRNGRLPLTIVISGEATTAEAVRALRLGVQDFIEKPFSRERLLQSLHMTLELAGLRMKVERLEARLGAEPVILGRSPAIVELRRQIVQAARTESRILILGESGSGKDLVAEALHRQSERREGPFVRLNCAALPVHLVEDELFGHVRGAFTDARTDRAGLFEEAHGGTLFLDEIGDMSPELQAKLLRVLEDGSIRRLGETRERRVDVRILAATHRSVQGPDGRLREDLYFRLAHLPMRVPSLRERSEDIPLLFEHFLAFWCAEHRLRLRQVEAEVMDHLKRYSWPGNVRELKSLCERLVVFGGDPITVEHLPSDFFTVIGTGESGLLRLPLQMPPLTLRDLRWRCEREYIENVLQRTGWNYAAAARLLDVDRSYLHAKARRLGIRRPDRQPAGEAQVPRGGGQS